MNVGSLMGVLPFGTIVVNKGAMLKKAVFFLAMLLLWSPVAAARGPYILAAPCGALGSCRVPEWEAVMKELYERVGLEADMEYMPPLRELHELEAGHIDACLSRAALVVREHADFVVMPTPLVRVVKVAFTRDPQLRVTSTCDLKGKKIGLLRGDISSISLIGELGGQLHYVDQMDLGFRMLQKGRIDVFLQDRVTGQVLAEQMDGPHFYVAGVVGEVDMYHVLHRRHAHLVPRLDAAWRSMIKDGSACRLAGRYASMVAAGPGKCCGNLHP